MFLCRLTPGSHAVIMFVRLSTGSPNMLSTRSMCGTKMVCGRHHAFEGRMSGHADISYMLPRKGALTRYEGIFWRRRLIWPGFRAWSDVSLPLLTELSRESRLSHLQ